jgi:hypothetical protein
MNHLRTATFAIALVLAPLGAVPAVAAPVTYEQVKTMVANMGYTPTQISKGAESPKFEFAIKSGTFNVPIGVEISGSGKFIWLSVNLGTAPSDPARAVALLKRIASTQPTHFWIASNGNLMCGMAIDNREVTPAALRLAIDKVGADVAASAPDWQG